MKRYLFLFGYIVLMINNSLAQLVNDNAFWQGQNLDVAIAPRCPGFNPGLN